MKRLIYIAMAMCFAFCSANAQESYYYYGTEKIQLIPDREYICINSSTDNNFLDLYNSFFISKTEFDTLYCRVLTDEGNEILIKTLYSEVRVTDVVKNNNVVYNDFLSLLTTHPSVINTSLSFRTLQGKLLGLTNNFYVKIAPSSLADLKKEAKDNNVAILGKMPHSNGWYILSTTKSTLRNSLELANHFYESGLFIASEPEFVYRDLQTSNDTYYSLQWGLRNNGQYGIQYADIDIKAEQAWTITNGNDVKVAIYDNGIEIDHPDLCNNIYSDGFDAITGSAPSILRGRHGTACAGIVGAIQDNNIGISGVAPESDIIPISSRLSFFDTPAQFASGFYWAALNNIDIISNSWGLFAPSAIIEDAVYYAIENGRGGKGCVVVFATGNEYSTEIRFPASHIPEIVAVGAITPSGMRAGFSNYGSQLDVVAPGVKIVTTDLQGGVGYDNTNYTIDTMFDGTSAACPHVAGVAALILSVNPCLGEKQVRDIIEKTAQKINPNGNTYIYSNKPDRPNGKWHNQMGYGLVDAYAAVKMAQSMNSPTLDLYVKDSNNDLGEEPNPFNQYLWTSDNIWVRVHNDNGLTHQNPEFSYLGTPNYVKVRVINKSCVNSTGNEQLKLHWAKAATDLTWPDYWDGSMTVFNPTINQSVPLGGVIGSVNIPVLQPGEEVILTFPWEIPNPALYQSINTETWHFCLLARIISTEDPMTFEETWSVNVNTGNNNNIAWKNVSVVDVYPDDLINIDAVIAVGNPFNVPTNFILEMFSDANEVGKSVCEEAEISVKLDDVLYQAWTNGGQVTEHFKSTNEDQLKIVTGNNAKIKNINLAAKERGTIQLSFNFLTRELTDKSNFIYHVVQKNAATGEIIGGETFVVNKRWRSPFFANTIGEREVAANESVILNAEDICEPANYRWYDSNGNLICEGRELAIANAVAEKYRLEVISVTDGFKDYTEIDVRIKQGTIDQITPNPSTNSVTINYQLNNASSAYIIITGYYGSNETSNNHIIDITTNQITLDISSYPIGLYSVSLVVNGEIADVKTLVKQ